MPRSRRRQYPRTDETYDVLRKANLKNIAKEYPCDDSYLYTIKDGKSNDPYGHFRVLYKACADAGAEVDIWLNDLIAIKTKARKENLTLRDIAATLMEKIRTDADSSAKLLESLRDNQLDRKECHEILAAFAANDTVEDEIKRLVQLRLAEIGEKRKPLEMIG